MSLKIAVPGCPGDATHEILVTATGTGDDFEVELVNHEDPEQDDMLVFMGVPRCECYHIHEILALGLQEVFEDPDFTEVFLKALKDQGIEALGMDREVFARYIVNFIEWTLEEEGTCAGNFMEDVYKNVPWIRHTEEFKAGLNGLVKLAYENDDLELFRSLDKGTDRKLITTKTTDVEHEETGVFSGHAYQIFEVDFLVGDESIESWTFAWKGWFCQYAPLRWCTEVRQIEEPDWYKLGDFLRIVGIDCNAIEADNKPSEPDLPNDKPNGDWAVLFDGEVWGHFGNEEDAYAIYDAMRDSSSFRESTVGADVTIVHKAPNSDEPDEEYDPEDPTTWESIVSDEV